MDPIRIATAAFTGIKTGVSVGKDLQSLAGDIGKLWGAIDQIKDEHNTAKSKRRGSVEEEALHTFMAKKKAEDMREELKNLISFTRGPSAWEELLKTEADIRKKRQQAIYDQQERQRKFFEIVMVIIASAAMIGLVGFVIYLVGVGQGKW